MQATMPCPSPRPGDVLSERCCPNSLEAAQPSTVPQISNATGSHDARVKGTELTTVSLTCDPGHYLSPDPGWFGGPATPPPTPPQLFWGSAQGLTCRLGW